MEEKDHNNWENWAAKLHGETTEPEDKLDTNSGDKQDKKVVENIFGVRTKVRQVQMLSSKDAAWEALKVQITPKLFWREFAKYAAIIILSITVGGAAFWAFNTINTPLPEYASITAPNGQISNVTLFDGTNIWLNAGSTLKYNQSFNQNNREVFLEGEAFFEVTKNKNSPFVVNAGNTQIKVLGTVFNVKAYSTEPKIETVLVEGKVQFVANGKSTVLKPGEHLLFSEKTGRLTKSEVNTSEFTAWKGGKIYYNNETLVDLTLQLERWYEVKFQFNNEHIKNYRFTGVINKDKTLEYTLNIITEINKVDFELNNEQITITDKK